MGIKFKYILLLMSCPILLLMSCGGDNVSSELPSPPEQGGGGESDVTDKVSVYVTTSTRSKDLTQEVISFDTAEDIPSSAITINPVVRYQSMDGFGAAVTGSTCYNLLKMNPERRTQFLKETFSDSEGLGFSYIRISIGCSDFSLSEYTCCDKEGIENFALQKEEKDYVIPVLKEILAINPAVKILGSPWTCPRWMKVEDLTSLKPFNSWTSGQLNPVYYQDYATYFVKWIQAFKAEGIDIYAVTPQNEPLNRGNSASLYMGWEEEAAFVKEASGPQFRENQITTKIYAYDHNYDEWDYPIKMYDDEVTASFLTGAAYHNYLGNRSNLVKANDVRPDKELIFTETSIGMWNEGRNLGVRLLDDMKEVALGTVNNWCKAVIVWNLMLDLDMGPNRKGGCQSCYGAVDISKSDYSTIIRNSHYYIIGHLSAVVKPGAVRIGTKNSASGIVYSAFENLDGTYAFVVMNEGSQSRRITLSDGKRHFYYTLLEKSVSSFRWKK